MTLRPLGRTRSRSSSRTTCGTHRTQSPVIRLSTASVTRRHTGSACKVASMRCKKGAVVSLSTFTRKRANSTSLNRVSRTRFKRSRPLLRNLAASNSRICSERRLRMWHKRLSVASSRRKEALAFSPTCSRVSWCIARPQILPMNSW